MKKTKLIIFLFLLTPLLAGCNQVNQEPDNSPRPSIGNKNAPILVEEFSDLQCPACAQISPQLEEVIRENPNLARLEYYHYPLPQHAQAFKASEASECAKDQDKFWDYVQILFQNQNNLGVSQLKNYAADMGLNANMFNTCLDSGKKSVRIKEDIKEGNNRNLQFTPSIYVNGKLVTWNGAENFIALLKAIQ